MKNKKSLLCRIAIVDALISQLESIKGKSTIPNNEINLAISDLGISKQALYEDLAKLDFMKQFTTTPWVIKNNPSQPTYYQLVSIVGKVVTLSRKGVTKIVSYQDFYRDYVEAKEDQVLQHVKYLTDNKIKFLFVPIPCDTSEVPILNISGTISSIVPIAPKVKKPANADFFMVTLKQGYGSKVYHESYEIAEKEAIRLSKQENKKAYILGVVGEINVVPTTTYETNIIKY
jgi:hypothetical protein